MNQLTGEVVSAAAQVLIPALVKMGADEEPNFFQLQSFAKGFEVRYFVDERARERNEVPLAILTVSIERSGKEAVAIQTKIKIKDGEQVSKDQI